MDLREVFKDSIPGLSALKKSKNIDEHIPLIGYAIGFPPIFPDPGGHYVRGNYNIAEDEPEIDEIDDEIFNVDEN